MKTNEMNHKEIHRLCNLFNQRLPYCNTNKKIPNIFNFIDPKSFELPEISGVSRDVETNNFLRMAQN